MTTNPTSLPLLPCPHCGVDLDEAKASRVFVGSVFCYNCQAQAPRTMWNTRAPVIKPTPDMIERHARAVHDWNCLAVHFLPSWDGLDDERKEQLLGQAAVGLRAALNSPAPDTGADK